MKFHSSQLLALSALPQLAFSAAITHDRRSTEGKSHNFQPRPHFIAFRRREYIYEYISTSM
jgi:hypothetical protein